MMNIFLLVIGSSLALQLMAALIAVRLIPQRGKRIAGVFMLSATLLMSLRCVISLHRLATKGATEIDLTAEITGCAISFMLLVGFLYLNRFIMSFQQKIEEHTRAEDALRDINVKLQTLIHAIPDAVFFKDARRRYLMVNKAFEELTGATQDTVAGKTDEVLMPFDVAEGCRKSDEELIRGRKPVYVEDTVTGRDGVKRVFDSVKTPIYDSQGNFLGIVGMSRNITERKNAEELIARLHHRNELILNSAGEGIYGVDLNGNTTFINPAAAKMIGWKPEELLGKQQHDILHHSKPDGTPYPKADCRIYAAFKDGKVHQVNDEVFWRKDGTSFPVEYTSTPLWEDGKVVGAVVVFKDSTELKRTEENLKLFLQAIEEAMDGIQIVDLEGRIIYSNTAVEEIYGYSSDEIIGKQVGELNADNELAGKVIIPSIQETDRWSGELMVRHKDGHEFPIWLSTSMVKNDAGGPIAMLGIIRDVTQRKRAEEVLRRSHDDLEILVAERTAELTMVNEQLRNLSTHLQNARENERTTIAREIHDELGQSLTAIKMDLSLLRKRLPKGDKPVIEIGESMARLIKTTIRSVKRISTDLRPGILDHLGLTAAIEWQAEEFEKRTGIHCAVSFEPEEVVLDKDRTTTVFRIFQEALTNVARHAKATEVSVLLKVRDDGLMFQIRDNGRGITEKQVSDPKSLGLIGVRERVYYWGGSFTIDGSRNKGTTITVQLPLDGRRGTH